MPEQQRRRFSRIRFASGAKLAVGAERRDCEVIDLSMKGALVAGMHGDAAAVGTPCALEITLGEDDRIRMEGVIAHKEAGRLGVAWREIDLDSLTHLRRLLELNLGDPELLGRELGALIAD